MGSFSIKKLIVKIYDEKSNKLYNTFFFTLPTVL